MSSRKLITTIKTTIIVNQNNSNSNVTIATTK